MKHLTRIAVAIFLVAGCAPKRTPSPEYANEPWASLKTFGDDVHRAAEMAKNSSAAGNDRDNADGGRYIAEILRQQLDLGFFADPDHPVFRPQFPESAHTGLVNPDNLYENTRIRPGVDYLVRGTRGSTADVVLQVYEERPGVKGSLRGVSTLSLDDLVFEDDGSFEVHVGPTPHEKNWLRTDETSGLLLIRWSHSDWANERAGRAEIVPKKDPGQPSAPPNVGEVSRDLRDSGAAIPDAGQFWLDFVGRIRFFTGKNEVMKPRSTGGEGLEGQVSAMGQFALRDDQALIVTVPKADTRYQGLQLGNYWFDALEWANRQTSLAAGQSHLASDGRYHYVISKKDPGVVNWLDTTGLEQGLFFLRYQGLRRPLTDAENPSVRLVGIDEVRTALPADTPTIGAQARREQLAQRQLQLQRRYGR